MKRPVFRKVGYAVVPIAIALIVYLNIATHKARHPANATLVDVAQAGIVLLALLLSSPLFAQTAKRLLIAAIYGAAVGWLIFSVVLVGGHYHWWPSPVKPKSDLLIQNIAYLTCMIGVLLILYAGYLQLKGRRAWLGAGVPSLSQRLPPTRDQVDRDIARQLEQDSQRQRDQQEWEADQDRIWRDGHN